MNYYNENDPRSDNYKRIYNKEPINKCRFFVIIIIDIFFSLLLYYLFKNFFILIIINFIYYLILLKYIIIFIIKIYQKIAPIRIRNKCRFEPSCSNYMLKSLEKYGLFKGLKKGINRLKRCNINNGGFDYP